MSNSAIKIAATLSGRISARYPTPPKIQILPPYSAYGAAVGSVPRIYGHQGTGKSQLGLNYFSGIMDEAWDLEKPPERDAVALLGLLTDPEFIAKRAKEREELIERAKKIGAKLIAFFAGFTIPVEIRDDWRYQLIDSVSPLAVSAPTPPKRRSPVGSLHTHILEGPSTTDTSTAHVPMREAFARAHRFRSPRWLRQAPPARYERAAD